MPTGLTTDQYSAVAQMEQVDQLKILMKKIVSSTKFKDLESGKPVLNDPNNLETDKLKEALNQILSNRIIESTKGSQAQEQTDTVDLYMNSASISEPRSIKQEQMNSFLSVQTQVDEIERVVGQWIPNNKFTNIYAAIDHVQEQIEEFYYTAEQLPSTPS